MPRLRVPCIPTLDGLNMIAQRFELPGLDPLGVLFETLAQVRQVLEGGRVALHVTDDGPGFPEEMLRTGIRPFTTGRAGGTGLGLAMVRRFVRDHDGDLALSNQNPRGAQVSLYLPCKAH